MVYRALISMFFVLALATSCTDNVTIDVIQGRKKPTLAAEEVSVNGGSSITNQGSINVKIPESRAQFPYEFKICTDEKCSTGCSTETAMKLTTGLSIEVASEGEYWVCLAHDSGGGEKIWLPVGDRISVDWTPPVPPTVILDALVEDAVVFEASSSENEGSTIYSGRICLDKLCTYGCADALKTSDTRFRINSLEQGKFYHACIQAKDSAGNTSQWAASEPFIDRSSGPILIVSDSGAPVTNAAQNLICSDQMYRDFNGELKYGTRSCGGTAATICSAEGETGCLVDGATQVVVAKTNLISANIRNGVILGGVTGSYPSLTSPLTGATATPDLSSMGAATPIGNYEFFDSSGNRYTGAIADGGTITPAPTIQTLGAAGTLYRAATIAGDADLLATNIAIGVNLFGVSGSASVETHSSCLADGNTGCVATASYAAAATSGLAAKILSGQTVAGVAGNVTLPGAGNVLTGISFGIGGSGSTGTLTLPSPANVRTGNGAFGVAGSGTTPTLADCSSDGNTGCVATATYTAALTTGLAPKIVSGNTVAGIAGSATAESHSNCSADGGTGCVATATYVAAFTTGLAPKIISGNTVAGIAGSATAESHSSCSADGATGCVATASYTAAATSGLAPKIVSGNTVAGVAGSATAESHSSCLADGATGCVATASYTAAATTGLAGKVLSGQTVAGVGGNVTLPAVGNVLTGVSFGVGGSGSTGTLTLPSAGNVRTGNGAFGVAGSGTTPILADCSADGGTGCVAVGPTFAAAVVTGLGPKVLSGNTVAGIAGSATAESHSNCSADGGTGCVATATYAAAFTTGLAPKIVSGNTVAGIAGSATAETHSSCLADGATGCVATATYTAALTTGLAGKVLSGQTVAGVGGNVTLPAVGNVLTGVSFGVGGSGSTGTLTLPSAGNVRTGNGAFGVAGSGTAPTLGDCSSDGGTGCVATATYTAAATAGLAPKIVSGNTVAGVAGSATAESHSSCLADGASGCVATASYTAAATTGLAGKVLSGQTVAGVGGNVTLPAVGNVLTGVSFGVGGSGSTGTLTLPSAGNVYTGNGAFGVAGSGTTPTLADCIANNVSGCVTTASYKSADFTNITAANIKNGVNLAGVTGDYPSATNRLASNTATTDLTLFITQLTSDGTFEFFDSAGTRYSGSGDSDITATNVKNAVNFENLSVTGSYTGSGGAAPSAWDVRAGVTVNGVAGKLRANCRNLITSSDFNYDGAAASIPATDITTGTTLDWWDTLDNYNNNMDALPNQVPTLWSTDNICNTTTEVWLDLTADGSCSADTDSCMFRDQITGLTWAEQPTSAGSVLTYTWPQAIEYCDSLSFGGHTDWRLPTQFEMMTAYTHGIRDIGYKGGTSATANNNQWFILNVDDSRFWTATSVNAASGTNNAWALSLNNGAVTSLIKGGTSYIMCVRP